MDISTWANEKKKREFFCIFFLIVDVGELNNDIQHLGTLNSAFWGGLGGLKNSDVHVEGHGVHVGRQSIYVERKSVHVERQIVHVKRQHQYT